MDSRSIGVFDSGLGGLTAVRQLRQLMPSENIIYFGDTARVPYGNRSKETLLRYARQDLRFLSSFDLKAVVIACGTVSTNCLEELRAGSTVPVTGVVEPAVERAAALTRSGKIGLAATRASVASGAYERAFRRLDPALEVHALERILKAVKEKGQVTCKGRHIRITPGFSTKTMKARRS